MKRLILCVLILMTAVPAKTDAPLTSLSFDNIKIGAFLRTVYQETLGTDYVLEPEVLADERPVNVRVYDFRDKRKLTAFLASMGYKVENRNGVDYIGKANKADELDFVVYAPKHKSVNQLRQALSGMFAGQFAGDERQLVFKGAKTETARLKTVLETFDTKPAELVVRGKIYEVSKKKHGRQQSEHHRGRVQKRGACRQFGKPARQLFVVQGQPRQRVLQRVGKGRAVQTDKRTELAYTGEQNGDFDGRGGRSNARQRNVSGRTARPVGRLPLQRSDF